MSTTQMRAWSIGLDMAYAAGGMLLLGAGIDWLAGTRPWWMLSLGLLGLIAGMYRFIRDAMRMNASTRPRPRAAVKTDAKTAVKTDLPATAPPDPHKTSSDERSEPPGLSD